MNTENKKNNFQTWIIILLALLLITQTAAILYYFTLSHKEPPAKTALHDAAPQNLQNYSRTPSSVHRSGIPARPGYTDPWAGFESSMDELMNGFFSNMPGMLSQMYSVTGGDAMLKTDLQENDKNYIVRVDMPGLDKDKIEITVRGEILTVQGVREAVEQHEGDSYFSQERSYGSFSRSFRLPGPVDETNISAGYQNGVLTITLPKVSEKDASKKISVN